MRPPPHTHTLPPPTNRQRQEQDKTYFEEQQAAQAAAHRKAWEVDVQEKKRWVLLLLLRDPGAAGAFVGGGGASGQSSCLRWRHVWGCAAFTTNSHLRRTVRLCAGMPHTPRASPSLVQLLQDAVPSLTLGPLSPCLSASCPSPPPPSPLTRPRLERMTDDKSSFAALIISRRQDEFEALKKTR